MKKFYLIFSFIFFNNLICMNKSVALHHYKRKIPSLLSLCISTIIDPSAVSWKRCKQTLETIDSWNKVHPYLRNSIDTELVKACKNSVPSCISFIKKNNNTYLKSFSNNGKFLAMIEKRIANQDGKFLCRVYDLAQRKQGYIMPIQFFINTTSVNEVNALAISNDGRTIVILCNHHKLYIINPENSASAQAMNPTTNFFMATALALHPYKNLLLIGSTDGTIIELNIDTLQERTAIDLGKISFTTISFSSSGKYILIRGLKNLNKIKCLLSENYAKIAGKYVSNKWIMLDKNIESLHNTLFYHLNLIKPQYVPTSCEKIISPHYITYYINYATISFVFSYEYNNLTMLEKSYLLHIANLEKLAIQHKNIMNSINVLEHEPILKSLPIHIQDYTKQRLLLMKALVYKGPANQHPLSVCPETALFDKHNLKHIKKVWNSLMPKTIEYHYRNNAI